jgi:hypothetical protein
MIILNIKILLKKKLQFVLSEIERNKKRVLNLRNNEINDAVK